MKTYSKIVVFLFSLVCLSACVSSESEMLKQARSIQEGVLKNALSLDSTMTTKLDVWKASSAEMAQDTTMSTDSLKLQSFMVVKDKIDNLSNLQSELAKWKSELKLLPSVQEMVGGGKNPFGEKAKDQEILIEIKKSGEALNSLKIKAETAMK